MAARPRKDRKYLLLSPLRRVHDLSPETVSVELARDIDGLSWAVPCQVRYGKVFTKAIGTVAHDPRHQQFATPAFMARLVVEGIFNGDGDVLVGDFDAVRRAWELPDTLKGNITRR